MKSAVYQYRSECFREMWQYCQAGLLRAQFRLAARRVEFTQLGFCQVRTKEEEKGRRIEGVVKRVILVNYEI